MKFTVKMVEDSKYGPTFRVRASYMGLRADEFLSECSQMDEDEFVAESPYYAGMCRDAEARVREQMDRIRAGGRPLVRVTVEEEHLEAFLGRLFSAKGALDCAELLFLSGRYSFTVYGDPSLLEGPWSLE